MVVRKWALAIFPVVSIGNFGIWCVAGLGGGFRVPWSKPWRFHHVFVSFACCVGPSRPPVLLSVDMQKRRRLPSPFGGPSVGLAMFPPKRSRQEADQVSKQVMCKPPFAGGNRYTLACLCGEFSFGSLTEKQKIRKPMFPLCLNVVLGEPPPPSPLHPPQKNERKKERKEKKEKKRK